MKELPDELLIKAYLKSKKLGLDSDFILILEEEINLRKLDVYDFHSTKFKD